MHRSSVAVVAAILGLASGGCHSAASAADAGVPAEGLEQYDSTATLLRGPWQLPAGPGAVTICWSTDQPARSRVDFGADTAYGTTTKGTVDQPAAEGSGETTTTGWQHQVTLTGLAEETEYHYRIASLAQPTADATLRAPAAATRSFAFVLMGDVRTNDADHQAVTDAIVAEAPDFVLNTGDLTEAGGVEDVWTASFFGVERALLATTTYLPVYGNHEDILGRTLFDTYFPAPPGARSPRTYSADWGGVHLAVIDRYQSDIATEAAWLDADLASSAAQAARLRVVALHPPLYTFANHEPDLDARAALWPILKARNVALLVTGHNHLYERFFVDGVQSVTAGGGGAPLYAADSNVIPAEQQYEKTATSQHHYVLGQSDGATFRFEVKPVPAGASLDCFVIDPQQPGVDLPCQ